MRNIYITGRTDNSDIKPVQCGPRREGWIELHIHVLNDGQSQLTLSIYSAGLSDGTIITRAVDRVENREVFRTETHR